MHRDFTFKIYKELCLAILENGFIPTRVVDYILSKNNTKKKAVIRHDVDRNPNNALKMAEIESDLDIKATYYFRTTKGVYNKKIIKKISEMGHEIGYHYEVLAKSRGDKEKAIELFEKELEDFRTIIPIKTICMHGSPLSKWTDSDLWNEYDYSDYNLSGEVYLSLDYENTYYYTDTGRKWDNESSNVRDKVKTTLKHERARSTCDLIAILPSIKKSFLLNSHPHRWHSSYGGWLFELLGQNVKNIGKKVLVKRN